MQRKDVSETMSEQVEEIRCEKRLMDECCEEPMTKYREVARQQ